MTDEPIFGAVPLERRKPGRPRGPSSSTPSKKKRGSALDEFDVKKIRKPGACPSCGTEAIAMDMDLVHELVRAARERIVDGDAESARTSVLHLAARLDGFCSLRCYKQQVGE